jgi:tetratricopeptide (TPR) repeat protein
MTGRTIVIGVLALLVAGAPSAWGQAAEARAAYVEGRYEDAIRALRRADAPEDVRLLIRAYAAVGRYDDALEAAERYEDRHPTSAEVANVRGEVAKHTGALDIAEAAFRRASAAGAPDSVGARLNLAILWHETGRRAEARAAFEGFVGFYNRNRNLSSEEIAAVATAVEYLGAADSRFYRDAIRAYDEAIREDPDNLEALVQAGDLLLEKYQGSEAREAFETVLARNLGLARLRRFAGSGDAMEMVNRALDTNPRLVAALVFRASLYVELEAFALAERDVDRAIEINLAALDALTVRAGIAFLQDDSTGFEAARREVFAINPQYSAFYTSLAELGVRNRRYAEAVELASQAVGIDSASWAGFQLLGINQLRIGAMRDGRVNLERAFAGNPYDVWTKNTLDLLDTLETYEVTTSDRFVVAIDRKESALLGPYMVAVAEEAYAAMAATYDFRPTTPVRIEVFPDHQDFSVRTVGLAGFGALGVSFGPVVAMDSPSARSRGEFHWASTLWHEIAHTFHHELSAHRVPRWFTEGLSVYEERRARPGWGDRLSPAFLRAFQEDRLHPVSELNNGFLRPDYPEQLLHSYYQASLVCDLIAERHGPEAFPAMLRAYADGSSTEEVFRSVLDVDIDRFDRDFEDYLKTRFSGPLAALRAAGPAREGGGHDLSAIRARADARLDDFAAQLAVGGMLVEQGRSGEAEPYLERARQLFPEYAGPGSPYELLARLYRERGDNAAAAAMLRALTERNAGHFSALLQLAELEDALDRPTAALHALDRAMMVYPMEIEPHRRLAALAEAEGRWDVAIRERRAVLALDPVDRADAFYRLAGVLFRADDLDGARRAVLTSLDLAPSFEPAQDLLLEIHDARAPR